MRRPATFILAVAIAATAGTAAWFESSTPVESSIETRYVLTGLGEYEIVDGQILVSSDARPGVQPVGHLSIQGKWDSISILADDSTRQPVKTKQIEANEFLIYGSGKVWVIATLANNDPFRIKQERFEVTIGDGPGPQPDPGPDPQPDPGPTPGPDPILATWMIFIEEQEDRASYPDEVSVMTSKALRDSMADRGISVRVYDDDLPAAKQWADAAGDDRPVLILADDDGGFKTFVVPKSVEGVEKIVRENVVR